MSTTAKQNVGTAMTGSGEDAKQKTAVVFHCDGGASLLEGIEIEEGDEDVVAEYLAIVRDALTNLSKQSEFRHVMFIETESPHVAPAFKATPTPLCIAVCDVQCVDGEVTAYRKTSPALSLNTLLGGESWETDLPAKLQDKISLDEETLQLVISEEELSANVSKLSRKARIPKLADEISEDMAEVLGAIRPQENELEPTEALNLIVAYITQYAGLSPAQPSLLSRVGGAIGGVKNSIFGVKDLIGGRINAVKKTAVNVEDLCVSGAKFAAKLAVHSVRPVLIGLVLRRALQVLDESRSVYVKMASLPEDQQIDFYYSQLVGEDWKDQFADCWKEAVQEVNDGYLTDEVRREKRKISAAILRRLEVDEWDKQRMRHYYYGVYGLGPWYLDMEERLQNPIFIGARAWNAPIESWVGENKVFPGDGHVPSVAGRNDELIALIEAQRGERFSAEKREALRRYGLPDAEERLQARGGAPISPLSSL